MLTVRSFWFVTDITQNIFRAKPDPKSKTHGHTEWLVLKNYAATSVRSARALYVCTSFTTRETRGHFPIRKSNLPATEAPGAGSSRDSYSDHRRPASFIIYPLFKQLKWRSVSRTSRPSVKGLTVHTPLLYFRSCARPFLIRFQTTWFPASGLFGGAQSRRRFRRSVCAWWRSY